MTNVVINGQKYQKANPHHGNWETPPEFFEELDGEFHFTLDAAASSSNALCFTYCTERGTFNKNGQLVDPRDGLEYDWTGHSVFCNPPYDRDLHKWVAKAAEGKADVAVLLLPPSVDTKWFHDYVWERDWYGGAYEHPYEGVDVRFLKGRLKFNLNGKPGPAPRAGNMLAIFWER